FVDRFHPVARRPGRRTVWREYTSIDFMHMHPGLRLLAHIAGSGSWDSPVELTFLDNGQPIFLDPTVRSASWSDLMADYDRDQGAEASWRAADVAVDAAPDAQPSTTLDFVGATENRI